MKLKLFQKQVENVNLCHFVPMICNKDGSVNVPFPNVSGVEMIDSLDENFKTRYGDFCSHSTNVHIFSKPIFC
jgi:hypothetical protein